MTAERVIRLASPEDFEALLRLRREYCQHVYKGFDVLCNLEDDHEFQDNFRKWLEDPSVRVSLLYLEDNLTAYCVYRMPAPDAGEILDLQYLPASALQDIQVLVENCIKEIEAHGASCVLVWIMRDNLRARFHYQQFGFKRIGGSMEKVVGGTSLSFTRYVYCLKDCPPDCI